MKLQTKQGRLTAYGFACGYVERYGSLTLTNEHNTYIVKGFTPEGKHVMKGADTLTAARKLARSLNRHDPFAFHW